MFFENNRQFRLTQSYCENNHRDELLRFGLTGEEEYIMEDAANYPPEPLVEEDDQEKGIFDIHAKKIETVKKAVPLGRAGDPAS